jgi:hypothetical protein
MSSFIITISRTIFFRLLAHAPEDLQREAKENARGAIPALCFTEDYIRKIFAQEELWDELSEDEQREAIRLLMDAGEYARAATVADEAIAEAVARYIHDAMLELFFAKGDCEQYSTGGEAAWRIEGLNSVLSAR